ncbi:SIS domain-containing protein [Streptosporangium sp. NPDC002544]|uniref:D-sedoheptulose-7-phosphate isomerase n=1 Tax=Streptosporangium sp. NPDC002544 TaxID=3154538 RepID=UPI003331E03B
MPVTPSNQAPSAVTPVTEAEVIAAFARREHAGRALAGDVEHIVRAARAMAARFHLGGKLIVFGDGGAGSDAAHVAVEFMHPVIVGKRALAAVALSNDATTAGRDGEGGGDAAEVFAHQVRHWADASDMALGISRDDRCVSVPRGLRTAGELGLLTIALTGGAGRGDGHEGEVADRVRADHVLVAVSDDPAVVKEVHVTAYHLLWELVHVFFDRLGPPVQGASR